MVATAANAVATAILAPYQYETAGLSPIPRSDKPTSFRHLPEPAGWRAVDFQVRALRSGKIEMRFRPGTAAEGEHCGLQNRHGTHAQPGEGAHLPDRPSE